MGKKTLKFQIFSCLLFLFNGPASFSQITIWSVNFNNGCPNDCIANTYGGWTILDNVGGVTGGAPNNWFVSCAEEGVTPPGCGSTCIGDASLHIGANPGAGGDMGASFNETGATNATFRQAVSPTVSTAGYFTNTLAFDFIAFGSSACSDDRAQLRLSTDNGATWPVGFQYCLTSVCCGACNGYSQGQWTTYTLALPAAFDNNPNVRVGFHWRNNGNGSGTDPSVAVDDVRITTIILPANLVQFNGNGDENLIKLNWVSESETQLNRYEVEKSTQPSNFKLLGKVNANSNQQSSNSNYAFNDPAPGKDPVFYRLKMIDNNGNSSYSNIVRVVPGSNVALDLYSFNSIVTDGSLKMFLWAVADLEANIQVFNLEGKKLVEFPNEKLETGMNQKSIDVSALASGVYILNIKSNKIIEGFDPVNLSEKFVQGK